MAFCTNCGSNMDANAHFCTSCGKSVTPVSDAPSAAAVPAQTYTPPPAAPQTYTPGQPSSSGGGLKIILIVIAVIIGLLILGIGTVSYIGYHAAKRMRERVRASQDGRSSSVDFGGGFKATTNATSARDLARKIGIDLYPGAQQQGDSSEATFGKMSTATIRLTTNDSVDKVASFYKNRYPSAMTSVEGSKFTLISSDNSGTLTLTAEESGGETAIDISKVSGLKINVH